MLCAVAGCSLVALGQGGGRGSAAPPPVQLIGGRFKAYPNDAIQRGTDAYNPTCGYCHGERGKGGNAGPNLIESEVVLHDEDGVQIGAHLKSDGHQKAVKLDLSQSAVFDLASYLHARIIATANRTDSIHFDDVAKAGDPKAGQLYFNGAGGCSKCHQPEGNLKGVGSKYDIVALQDRIVNPRTGRGGRGGAPDPTAITATVTMADGKTFNGVPLLVTDFVVTLRFPDGSTQSWSRENGVPKVERHDPLQAHVDNMLKLKDSDMHNLTAYLATLR